MSFNMTTAAVNERYDQIVALVRQGLSVNVIAERLGVSTRMVVRARKARGMSVAQVGGAVCHPPELWERAEEMVDDGVSLREIARTLGISYSRVSCKLRGRSQWTPVMSGQFRHFLKQTEPQVDKVMRQRAVC